MNRNPHIVHWVAPSVVVGTLMALYFSGIPALQSFVAPHVNRELGALESTQHLILLITLVWNVRTARAQTGAPARRLWWLISAGTLFLLLEELDYGQHYLEFLRGVPPEERSTLRSLHDGANTQRLKVLSDTIQIAFFVVLPWVVPRLNSVWASFFAPSRYALGTVLAGFLLSRLAHLLDDAGLGAGGALYSGIAEFREVFTYWLCFQYFRTLEQRSWPGG